MQKVSGFRRLGAVLCIAAIAVVGILSVVHPQRVQALGTITVTVIGTITDPAGVPYAGGTIDATLIPTGVTPTVPNLNGTPCGTGGCQITGYIQPVSINTDGTFALVVYCNTGCSAPISPSGTQWLFTVRNKGTQPPAGYGGVSFTVTETINVNGSQDIGADLRAAAPRLLVSAAAGAGPVTGSGTTGFIPLWSSSTQLGNSLCDQGITTASTITCNESFTAIGNITVGGGATLFTGTVESTTTTGGDLDVFCDSSISCHMNIGSNAANEIVSIGGGGISMSITGPGVISLNSATKITGALSMQNQLTFGDIDGGHPTTPTAALRASGTTGAIETANPAGQTFAGVFSSSFYSTDTECSSTAAPAVCGTASAGTVRIAAATSTLQVTDANVKSTSQIFYAFDLWKTGCTAAPANLTALLPPYTSAVTPNTNFTLTMPVQAGTNPVCIDYWFIN